VTADVQFRSDFDVHLVDVMGSDHRIVQAAKVSTLGADSLTADDSAGLVRYLMSNRHGSPFEHCVMQWMISAPIFVWREFHRHRIASYNEESSRYRQLAPVFYVPPPSGHGPGRPARALHARSRPEGARGRDRGGRHATHPGRRLPRLRTAARATASPARSRANCCR
jgi:hypothetical protein